MRGAIACALLWSLCTLTPAHAATRDVRTITVEWDAPDAAEEVVAYRAWCGGPGRNYYAVALTLGSERTATFTAPSWKSICCAVTAVNSVGEESVWSAEVCVPAVPTGG